MDKKTNTKIKKAFKQLANSWLTYSGRFTHTRPGPGHLL